MCAWLGWRQLIGRSKPLGRAFLGGLSGSERLPMLAIAAFWVAIEVLIDPRGNFPLNDDWCYARSVLILLHNHTLYVISIVATTLIAQIFWGTLFCLLFGPSFNALRLSTLTLGLLGLLVTYKFFRALGVSRSVAFIGCMVIAVNPLYLELSNTFMTDVPFFAFGMLSLYFYARGIKHESSGEIAKGALMSCVAVLTRQIGIVLPISFALAYFVRYGLRLRNIGRAALPAVAVSGTLVGNEIWMLTTGRTPLYYGLLARAAAPLFSNGREAFVLDAANVIRTASIYLGLFLFPFLILVFPKGSDAISPRQRKLNPLISGAFFLTLVGTLINEDRWMPLLRKPGNLLIDFGLGPTTLRDVWNLELPYLPTAPAMFWQIVTIVGAVGAALLVWHLLLAAEMVFARKGSGVSSDDRSLLLLFVMAFALFVAPNVGLEKYIWYDRYLLFAIPALMLVAGITSGRNARVGRIPMSVAALFLTLYGTFSVGATHDYLAWNRVRWQAGLELTQVDGIASNRIDGGYEFNGWLNYREELKQYWWKATTNDYMITFGLVDGYEEIKRYPFQRWMPYGRSEILVLKKTDYL